MIGIVDYGMGNLASLQNMIRKVGGEAVITSDPDVLSGADKLILPGVGAFDNAMKRLGAMGFIELLNMLVISRKKPVLCICLGCQLITKKSEEGLLPGFGWIDAETKRFSFPEESSLRIPHMGWNRAYPKKESRLFTGLNKDLRFYFVHSYHLVCNDQKDILSETVYGYNFVSAVERDNIFATQFHPEKSHKYGLALMKNFVEL